MIYDPIRTRTAAVWRQTFDNWDVHSQFHAILYFNPLKLRKIGGCVN